MLGHFVPSQLTREQMEERRLAAAKELLADDSRGAQARISKKYGVSDATANRWHQAARRGGLDALKSTSATGQPPKLDDKQKQKLARLLAQGAEAHGYETDVWTGKRVADLMHKEFRVEIAWKYVPQYLREQLGFTPQKPARQPHELDPAKIDRWIKTAWKAGKKGRSKSDG